MSSSDQQYPYPYDPERQQPRPASPHWPDGTAGQSAAPQDPAAFDQGATQTWQAPTWDTQYQPTIRPDDPHRAQGQAQGPGQGYGQPQQPQAYGTPQPDPYGQQQPGAYGTPQPHAPYPQQQYQEPQQHQQPQRHYQEPQQHGQHQQQPYRPSAADTAYLPPQGVSGSFPLPPEVPATPATPVAPAAAVPASASASVSEPATGQPGPGDTGYSAPTTLGNARITDAQRARAEGRSPIIAPGMQPAALTAVLGLLLAGGAAIGPYALLVPVVLLQAVTAAGWFRLNGMWPARQGIALAFAGGLVADAVLLAAGREHGPAALLGTLGVWVLLTVVLQLRSHAGADERMYGLMATVVSASLAVLAGGHLAALPDAVAVGGVAVAAATLARALPLPGAASVAVALLAGAGAGVAVGALTDFGAKGALLGLAAGGAALIGLRVASYDYPSRFVHMTAGVALPLTVAAPVVYLVGRAVL
ncbi:hypothetical protein [Streptomyces sp. SID14515]|uniref:hypothetical protein n=1 Tax=Streptomyces sp. SID14515 TaxID=2706074 RepID=UPI0013CB911F|nr:hypothetical protein [Streptomyces sp. SID14515]NEB40159.1 hypothetical protein [Streptomyces sp. SID14515]